MIAMARVLGRRMPYGVDACLTGSPHPIGLIRPIRSIGQIRRGDLAQRPVMRALLLSRVRYKLPSPQVAEAAREVRAECRKKSTVGYVANDYRSIPLQLPRPADIECRWIHHFVLARSCRACGAVDQSGFRP